MLSQRSRQLQRAPREKNAQIKLRLISGYWNVNVRWRAIRFRLRRCAGICVDNRESSSIEDCISALADISTHSLVAVSACEFEYLYFTGSKTNTLLGIRIAHELRQQSQTPFSNRNFGGHNANFCVSRKGTPTAWSLSPRHCAVQGARWFRECAKESPSRSRGELHGASRQAASGRGRQHG